MYGTNLGRSILLCKNVRTKYIQNDFREVLNFSKMY